MIVSNFELSIVSQGQADSSTNYVFSPLGYATILSILGQGAVGTTKDEIYKVLQQPESDEEGKFLIKSSLEILTNFFKNSVRKAYRAALNEFTGNDSMIAPQFKTWFYIYRNNSAEEDFKKILAEDYLVEIKDIERFDYNFDSPRTAESQNDDSYPTNSKDILQFEDLKNTEPKDDKGTIEGFDTLKSADNEPSVEQAIADYDQLNKDDKNKVSKFDKNVEDNQYIESPEIKNEIKKNITALVNEHLKKKLERENAAKEGPEKISLPLKKYMEDSMEIMEAQENRNFVSRVGKYMSFVFELFRFVKLVSFDKPFQT